ncbi:hypothetical protein CR194_15665 [Salipaludibacillus keqinensis]|uniref:HTH psq-type domain-containing protein n=1 Tax=Salipaludibacillus keqinensis TaxID=2045207 RepID=A0A323TI10_9BACI|nr:SEC-C metal-binding domain-containing protein [Salipaludibacillus keqinensis]PYZ92273.1 hypothetical protein CR194_15665 [Salipaludibacillus keqinensis]
MATLKRNDPCLCGSGKKYKKCCLVKLQAKPRFDEKDQLAFNELLPRVFDYSKKFDQQLQPVYERYVQSLERLPKADAQAFSQLIFHWMLFNYPMVDGNETILSDYVKKQGSSYSEKFQQFLQEWLALEPKLFHVTSSDDKNMAIYDVFQETSLTLEKTPASANLTEGDRLIGYLYPTPTGHSLGNDAIGIPQKLEQSFLTHLNEMKSLSETKTNEQEWFTSHFHEALDVLSLLTISGKELQAEERLNDSSKQVLNLLKEKLDWSVFTFDRFLKAKVTWIAYTKEHSPRIQKPEAFSAALEYWIGKQTEGSGGLSQKTVSEKYSVSPGTVSSKYKSIR